MKDLKKFIKATIREFLNENQSSQTYYRAVTEFSGENVVFEPKGYYEAFDDDGNAVFLAGDVLAKSKTPEISASKCTLSLVSIAKTSPLFFKLFKTL